MKKIPWLKLLTALMGVVTLSLAGIWYFIFYRPSHYQRNVGAETSISLSADSLVSAYENNENTCDSLFLNKVLEVTGEISEVKQNQEGKPIIILKSRDPLSNVSCTMRDKTNLKPGERVTLKGVCTGHLMDVVLIEAIPYNRS